MLTTNLKGPVIYEKQFLQEAIFYDIVVAKRNGEQL